MESPSSKSSFPPITGRCIINDLPSELLSHIFSLGWAPERDHESDENDFEDVDDDDSDDGTCSSASSLSDHSHSAPSHARRARRDKDGDLPFNVLVSHVCARWRAIALKDSLLWTHISFEGPPPWERALIYLDRASTAPLSINIDRTLDEDDNSSVSEYYSIEEEQGEQGKCRSDDNDSDLSIITEIMDIVVSHMHHIQVLQIMVSFYPHMHRALAKLGATLGAPLLEVLQLYHYEDTDKHDHFKIPELREQPFVLFNGNAPRLTHVALWGVHLNWSKEGTPFLTGLKDLELAYHARDVRPSYADFARIVRSCPDLRTLTFCLSCPDGVPAEWREEWDPDAAATGIYPSSPLVLSHLEDLVISYLEPPYALALVSRLYLPALTSLAIDLEDDEFSELLSYLSSPRSLPQPPAPPLALCGPGVTGSAPAPRARSLLSNLTSLKVASLPCNEGLVLEAYKQLDKLTALNLNMSYLRPSWFDLLLPSPSPSTSANTNQNALHLPRLETLTTTGISAGRLRELVEVRAGRGAQIRTLFMNEEDSMSDDEDEAWLAQHLERFELFEGSDEEDDESWGDDNEELDVFEYFDDEEEVDDDFEDDFDQAFVLSY